MEIRVGFEPTINSFAGCPLQPLEYRIMAGIVGFKPTVAGIKGRCLMQTVNRINVSNGDVGIITDVETEDDDTIARVKLLDGRELSYTQEMLEDLEFSYCTTIHKSQGQEYPVIIVPLLKEHYIMLRRNLLYTAVTRAKAKVILIGQKQAVFIAIHKCDVGQRNTVLADRIVAYYNRELSNQVT